MRNFFISLIVLLAFLSVGFADITPIANIQYTDAENGESPLKGQEVTVKGVVTMEPFSFAYGKKIIIQDADSAYSGIYVYTNSATEFLCAMGDEVRITGTVDEYFGLTQVKDISAFEIVSSGNEIPEPIVVTTAQAGTEPYESMLIKIGECTVEDTDDDKSEFAVNDGSGAFLVDLKSNLNYYYRPVAGAQLESVTGVMTYGWNNYKLMPRVEFDIDPAGKECQIQRVQQVYYTDMVKERDDSYLAGDTVIVEGVVTATTDLLYAGDGIKFYMADTASGKWSGVMVYSNESHGIDHLFEGDYVRVTAEVSEYSTDASKMTELIPVADIELLGVLDELPIDTLEFATAFFDTTTLVDADTSLSYAASRRDSLTEMYEGTMVRFNDVEVVEAIPNYQSYSFTDGDGVTWVRAESDSTKNYIPAPGTRIKSICGLIYDHYGKRAVSPIRMSDIQLFEGPPTVTNTYINPSKPRPTDHVVVYTSAVDDNEVTEVNLYYRFSGSAEFTKMAMEAQPSNAYKSQELPLPASESDTLFYYVEAVDNESLTTKDPEGGADSPYSVAYINPEVLTIYDVQFTETAGDDNTYPSPYAEKLVEVTGTVVDDSIADNKYFLMDYNDSEHEGMGWKGVYVYYSSSDSSVYSKPKLGDRIRFVGEVAEYNGKTELMSPIEVEKIGSSPSNSIKSVELNCAEFPFDNPEFSEQYEGVLITLLNVEVAELQEYDDFLVTDGAGHFSKVTYADKPAMETKFESITGCGDYSYGAYTLLPRTSEDLVEKTTDVKENNRFAKKLTIKDGYPNPFNAVCTFDYYLPQSGKVKIEVFNILGAKVAETREETKESGWHKWVWNANRQASGIYFYRLDYNGKKTCKKVTLLK